VELKDGWRFGFRITLNNWRFFGHEFGYSYNRTSLVIRDTPPTETGMAFHQPFYSFLAYATPEGTVVRPFVAGGGHVSNFLPPGASVTQGGGDNKFGYHYGGGLKVRVKTNWGVRLDVRQYITGKPFDLPGASGKLKQVEISAGFMFMM
jgi:opacity protein-like surface antigen